MHDMDRTSLEANGYDYEEAFEFDDEMDDEEAFEFDDEMDDEYDYEMDDEMDDEYDYEMDDEMDDEYDYEMSGSPFSEEEEAELAFELLSVHSQEEMDEFLGKLIKRAGRRLKRFVRKPFKYIKKGLRKVAKFALPIAGGVAGSFFGGPLGGALGGKLGKAASRFFEIELEGLSPEDQEFEIARRFVRFSGAAARNAMKNTRRMPPAAATKVGFKQAARKHAPGMLKPRRPAGHQRKRRPAKARRAAGGATGITSGRWLRKGNRIVLLGM